MHRSIYLFETMLGNILILFTVQIENDTKLQEEKDTQNNLKGAEHDWKFHTLKFLNLHSNYSNQYHGKAISRQMMIPDL